MLLSSPDEVRRGPFIVLHIEQAEAAGTALPVDVEVSGKRLRRVGCALLSSHRSVEYAKRYAKMAQACVTTYHPGI